MVLIFSLSTLKECFVLWHWKVRQGNNLDVTIMSLSDNLLPLCVKFIPICITAGLGTNKWPKGPHQTPISQSHIGYFHEILDILNWHFLYNVWIELWSHKVIPKVQNQPVKTSFVLHFVSEKQRLPLLWLSVTYMSRLLSDAFLNLLS